ncbi:MAG: hypothetical protein JWM04_797 [Verrucomicrobiales bacterium]|jgi:hypothetical protein|nr:hypothetical protein [Verrucomicrobiales bacterium]
MPKPTFSLRKKLTRAEQRDLDLEISFLEGIVRRDPCYVEALQILGDDYTRRGKITEGLRIDLKLADLRPEDPLVHYNLACSYSLLDEPELGLLSLQTSLKNGYTDFKWLTRDPDLRNVRRHPLYKKIRSQIRTLKVGSTKEE